MKKIIRVTAFIIFAVMLCLCAVSCGEDKNNPTVLKLDGYSVPLDEYRYFYLNFARDMDNGIYDDDISADGEARLRAETENALRDVYALYKMADQYNVSLSSDEKASITATVDQMIAAMGGAEEFAAQMNENFITRSVLEKLLEQESLEIELRDTVSNEFSNIIDSTDATVERDIRDNFIRVKHILVKTIDPNEITVEGQLPTGHDDAEALAIISEAAARANAGEDFESLIKEYSEDSGMAVEDGYYFTKGEFLEPFEEAAFALGIGEISGIVRTVNGYHIIKRYEQDPEYVNYYFEELREVYKARKFNELRDTASSLLKLHTTSLYDEITRSYLESVTFN